METTSDWKIPLFAIAVALALITEPGGVRVVGYGLLVGATVLGYLRLRHTEDEVQRAANVAAMSFGAPLGLGLAFVSIFAVRFLPGAQAAIVRLAPTDNPALDPAAAGFGIGVLFACVLVAAATTLSWVGWWLAKR